MSVWTRTRTQLGIALLGSKVGRAGEVITHTEAGADMPATATVDQEVARIRAIDAFHRTLGWGGFGYNAAAFPSGRAYEGRGAGRSGAHTKGQNHKPAIMLPGHGDRTAMTAAQITAHRRIQAQWIRDGHLTERPHVSGHRDYAAKSCPGSKVYPQLPQVRGVTAAELDPPKPTPAPPQEDDMGTFILKKRRQGTNWLINGGRRSRIDTIEDLRALEARFGQAIVVEDSTVDGFPWVHSG